MIQIFVDSGANLSAELREQYNIHLLPMALTINDQPAPEGLDGHEYYEALRSGADVRTSMVNPDDAKKAFETYVSQGDDVVYFSISAGISGSWWSAKLAGDELMEEYPGRRVCPIDSMGASLGAGIPALKASSLVRQGMELDELVEKMTVYCQNYCQYFAVDDLKYLRKGGRISGMTALRWARRRWWARCCRSSPSSGATRRARSSCSTRPGVSCGPSSGWCPSIRSGPSTWTT